MLAYGCSANSTDEYCRLSESTALECLQKFCSFIEAVYGQWYIRSPNPTDLYRLLHKASRRGFPGMLGSLDYMHWNDVVNGNEYNLGYYLADGIYLVRQHW
ncbi:hypothetical protein L3X38_024176 [Prunus dulcis]|uniref:Uncharacterized protein n=1 Tax=Prunus dulcis TaxID=3755 RepID=A0AAD4Z6R8_PRUDU|nr:hypothetical protein L3X38_024176 [Prunus dulcis]